MDFITSHSHISAECLQQLMRETGQLTADVGTVISGKAGGRAWPDRRGRHAVRGTRRAVRHDRQNARILNTTTKAPSPDEAFYFQISIVALSQQDISRCIYFFCTVGFIFVPLPLPCYDFCHLHRNETMLRAAICSFMKLSIFTGDAFAPIFSKTKSPVARYNSISSTRLLLFPAFYRSSLS